MNKTTKELIANAQISKEYNELKKFYNTKSILQLVGKERDENVHSDMIAWLLDDSVEHKLGLTPIRYFLRMLPISIDKEENILAKEEYNNYLLSCFLNKDLNILNINIKREHMLGKDGKTYTSSQRIDILIEITILINNEYKILPVIIENKVKSDEHDDQTISYKEWSDDTYSDSSKFFQPILIFLTPKKQSKPNEPSFIKISYQELVDRVIDPCLIICESNEAIFRLKDYLRTLTYTNFEKITEKGDIVMAMTKSEKDLLLKFKEENKDLLLAIREAIREDEKDSEIVEAIEEINSSIVSRNNDKYVYNSNVYKKGHLVYQVIKDYVNKGLVNDSKELKSKFEYSGTKPSKRLFYTEEEYNKSSDQKRYHKDPIVLNSGEIIYISNQIGSTGKNTDSTNLDNFLELCTKLGINIELYRM